MAATIPTRLDEIKAQLSADQLRFLAERVLCRTDKEAADNCNIVYTTVTNWPEKQLINEAVRLLQAEGVEASREILRRKLVKAAQVKGAGLDSRKEAIKQAAATEILDRFHGKPKQAIEATVAVEATVKGYMVVSPDDWDESDSGVSASTVADSAVA